PALVPAALAVFDAALGSRPHQLENKRPDVQVTSENILDITGLEPIVTEQGVRMNIRVAVGYMNEWLGGNGHVALENQLEDVSTAEICRSQIWQWIHHEVTLDNGRQLTPHLAERYLGEELAAMERRPDDHFDEAVGTSAPRRWGRPSPNSSPCRPTPITWSTGCRRPTPRCSSPERPCLSEGGIAYSAIPPSACVRTSAAQLPSTVSACSGGQGSPSASAL